MNRRYRQTFIIVLMICMFLIYIPSGLASTVDEGNEQRETIYVLLKNPNQVKKLESLLSESQVEAKKIEEIGFLELKSTPGELKEWLKKALREVELSWYEEASESAEAKLAQNKSYWDLQGIEELNLFLWFAEEQTNHYKTYDVQEGNPGVKVALLDSGIDLSNDQLRQSVLTANSWNFIEGNNIVQDETGHGTQVAGVINLLAPKVSIVPYKIMNDEGDSFALLSAIVRATNDGNQILNISAGSYIEMNDAGRILKRAYQRAVDYAVKNKTVVVASAGNQGIHFESDSNSNEIHVPSMLEHVISVGAVTKSNHLAPYSNYGPYIDFVASGGYFGDDFDTTGNLNVTDLMLTAFPKSIPNSPLDSILNIPQGYSLSFGTSLAAPQVSATIAILMSNYYDKHHRYLDEDKIVDILRKSSIDLGDPGKDDKFGYGEVILDQALKIKN